jgi:hypothetical protein
MAPGRYACGDWFSGTPVEFRDALTGYIAYFGRYSIDAENDAVIHHVDVSFFPNWKDTTQRRQAVLQGDQLQLSSEEPFDSSGRTFVARILWKRAA